MEDLQKSGYLCHPHQMYTLRRVNVSEGKAKGTAIIEVSTAGGLQVDILPDAGLDIGQVRSKRRADFRLHPREDLLPFRLRHLWDIRAMRFV